MRATSTWLRANPLRMTRGWSAFREHRRWPTVEIRIRGRLDGWSLSYDRDAAGASVGGYGAASDQGNHAVGAGRDPYRSSWVSSCAVVDASAVAAVVAGIALVAHTAIVQPRPSWAWVDVAVDAFLFHLVLMYLALGLAGGSRAGGKAKARERVADRETAPRWGMRRRQPVRS